MKIGILGTRGIPNAYGGFEQFAEHLSKGLVERGHNITVYNSTLHPYKEKIWQGVEITHCFDPEDKIGTAGQFIYDYNCLRDAAKKNYDCLLHLGYTSSSVWHRLWPKNSINIVNMDGLEWKRSKYNRYTRRFLRWAESLAAHMADVLVADSPGIKDYLQKTYNKNAHYIAYGAEIPSSFSENYVAEFDINPYEYYLIIARMEPENNIEMIVEGYLQSKQKYPLLIIGSTKNKFGQYLSKKYSAKELRFPGGVYDKEKLDSLRHFSKIYFHGHSVGGTNPSLLEAMACKCNIAAHENEFNRAILDNQTFYFSNPGEIKNIIDEPASESLEHTRKNMNIERIKKLYTWDKINNDYERVFKKAIEKKKYKFEGI